MSGLLDFLGGPTDVSAFDPAKLGLLRFLQQQGMGQPVDPNAPVPPQAAPPQMGLLSSLMGQTPLAPPQPDDSEADSPAPGATPASLSQAPAPAQAPMSLAGATTPAPPVTPAVAPPAASGGGFLDKIGNIYGAGGGGDGLINLGLALMSPGNRSENLMRAAAMNQQGQTTALANQQKLASMQSRFSMLKAAGKSDAEASSIANSDGAFAAFVSKNQPKSIVNTGNGNLYDPQTKEWIKAPDDGSTNTKYTYMKSGDGSILGLNPNDPADVKIVAKGGTGAASGPSEDLVNSLASRAIQGDASWKTGLARVPGLITAVEEEVAKRGKSDETGSNAGTILQNRANQYGRNREQGTLGTATANNTLYGNAAASTMDTAISASRSVPRGTWMPINKIMQSGQTAMSDPNLAAFVAANNTLVNDYAKAVTPAGVPTDSQRAHAEQMLNTAQSPEAYEKVVNMMHNEISNTHRAIEYTKEQLRSGHAEPTPPLQSVPGAPGSASTGIFGGPAAPAVAPPPPSVGTVLKGHRFKGGNPADPSSWEPVGGGA